MDKADLNYIPGVSMRDFEVEIAGVKASDIWVNKFKSLNEDFKRLAQQQIALVSKHKWTEMKKISTCRPADNSHPVTNHTPQRVSIAVVTMFGSTYACELKNIKTKRRSRLTYESRHEA